MISGTQCVFKAKKIKEWMGFLLDDFKAFGIQTDQCMFAAKDADEW